MKAAMAVGGLLLMAALSLPPLGPELRFRWNLWALRHRPGALFERAERHYEANDHPKSRAFVDAALRVDPRHAGARALSLELGFLEGNPWILPDVTPSWAGCLIEIDSLHASATRAYGLGDRATARTGFRRIVELSKWLPTGIELESRRKSAQEMLDRIAAEK